MGESSEYTNNMMKIENLPAKLNIDRKKLFSAINEREREILESRYGIDREKATLAAIGNKYGLSRERIRQIEARAKSRLSSEINKSHSGYFEDVLEVISENGGVITENFLASLVKADFENLNYFKLLLDLTPGLVVVKGDDFLGKVWRRNDLKLERISNLIKLVETELKKAGQPITTIKLVSSVGISDDFDEKLFEAIKTSTNHFMIKGSLIGLTSDRAINPKTVSDKVLYLLEEAKRPIHFAEIAEEIEKYGFDKKKINKSTVHNELIASDKFVLVGRGTYALKKWGYRDGSLQDLIVDFLEKNSQPQSLKSLIEHISTERTVKRNTILVNLAKCSKIARNVDGRYSLV